MQIAADRGCPLSAHQMHLLVSVQVVPQNNGGQNIAGQMRPVCLKPEIVSFSLCCRYGAGCTDSLGQRYSPYLRCTTGMLATTNDPGSARATLRGNAAILNDHDSASHSRQTQDRARITEAHQALGGARAVCGVCDVAKPKSRKQMRAWPGMWVSVVLLVYEISANCQGSEHELLFTKGAT